MSSPHHHTSRSPPPAAMIYSRFALDQQENTTRASYSPPAAVCGAWFGSVFSLC